MRRRGIRYEDVLKTCRNPESILDGDRPGRIVRQGRVEMGVPAKEYLLRVVLDVSDDPAKVVTAYATTRFQKYGASE